MRATLTLTVVLLTLAPIQAAEKPPLDVTAEVGFANHFPHNRPFPFTLDLSGAQREITGSVRVYVPNVVGGETVLETPIALTPGAHKRWRFTLPPIVSKNVKVDVLDRNGLVLSEQEFFGMPVGDTTSLILVVQDESSGRFTLPRSANEKDINGAWRAASVPPDVLPEDALAYAGVSAIMWRIDKPKALNEPQARALVQWLKQGGLLVITGGRNTPPNLPRDCRLAARWGEMESFDVRELLGSRLTPSSRPVTMLTRPRTTPWNTRSLPDAKIAIRPLIPEGARSRLQIGARTFLAEQAVGGGAIVQMAFDPQDLVAQGVPLGIDFWEQVFWLPDPHRSPWAALDWLSEIARDNSRSRLAEAANYRVDPVWHIAWVFGIFFGVAFCANFLFFRKSRRFEWAWLLLLVASIGMFLYNRAFGRVGGFGPTRHVEITRSYGVAGERSLLSFTETGVLAPRTHETKLVTTRPQQVLAGFDSAHRQVVANGSKLVYPMHLRAGAFNTCSSVAIDELPGDGVGVSWKQTADAIEIHLANKTKTQLLNVRVFPASASMRIDGNDDFFVKIPIREFQQWMQSVPGVQVSANIDTSNNNCTCPPSTGRPGYSGLSRFTSTSSAIAILPEDEGMEQAHLLFRFELPESSTSLTTSDANEVRCRRSVTLFIPVAASLDEVNAAAAQASVKPETTYSGRSRFQ